MYYNIDIVSDARVPAHPVPGTQWTSMLSSESLGTGNSQWLVVDYNRQ